MFKHRLIRTVTVIVALGAARPGRRPRPIDAQPGSTLPHDFQTAATRDAVVPRGLYEPMRPRTSRSLRRTCAIPTPSTSPAGAGPTTRPRSWSSTCRSLSALRSRPAASTGPTPGSAPAASSASR